MNEQEQVNGRPVQPQIFTPQQAPSFRQPLRYELSRIERLAFLKMQEVMVRTEAAMQGAMQLILEQQGMQSPRGFRLEKDCSALVEQS